MLTAHQLRERVAAKYPDSTQVADTVVRFVRTTQNRPYAICYIDVADRLPSTHESLTRYQDEVIGKHYFEGAKSLQWSNYLYFVTSPEQLVSKKVQGAKDVIEADRSYARKFVISEDELDDVLSPPPVAIHSEQRPRNVLSVWTERLTEAALDAAILSEDDLPGRLAKIESSATRARGKQVRFERVALGPPPGFIRSFNIKNYRPYPVQNEFQFGTVNLVYGPNASGKTSLLEAIELFFCGRNSRSPKRANPYHLSAIYSDGRAEQATSQRRLKLFRDRNLSWYGRHEIKTNTLHESFALFNFLDTDAAVRIADSTSTIDDDLSKLLIGPDASKIWDTMRRVYDTLRFRLNDQRKLEKALERERDEIEASINRATNIKRVSETISSRLNRVLSRLKWTIPDGTNQANAVAQLVSWLSELVSLTEQASSLAGVPSPISLMRLTRYSNATDKKLQQVDPEITLLRRREGTRRQLETKTACSREALPLANKVKRLLDADVPKRDREFSSVRDTIARLNGLLAGFDKSVFEPLLRPTTDLVTSRIRQLQLDRTRGEQTLQQSRDSYARYSSLRERSFNLAQELRQTASEILKISDESDECPLCHTRFPPGELSTHMALGVDAHEDGVGRELLKQIEAGDTRCQQARAAERAHLWLKEYLDRCELSTPTSVSGALAHLSNSRNALIKAEARHDQLASEVEGLEAQGLSQIAFLEAVKELEGLGYSGADEDPASVTRLIDAIADDRKDAEASLKDLKEQINGQVRSLQKKLESSGANARDLAVAMSRLKEDLEATKVLLRKLEDLTKIFPWPRASAVSQLTVEAKSVLSLASQLQVAFEREEREMFAYAQSTERKDDLDNQLLKVRARRERFQEAKGILERLINEESMSDAMEAALRENRDAIESTFSRIHAPAEFSGLGTDFGTLIRKVDQSKATLAEISTGQRAALALSIFLAQNAQLTAAPPVMLVDDPIAHIDDLNILSFLDYLREVAIAGRRQIFFATANDKIATLFQRKFDFLGDTGFRRIELSREQ